ERSALVAQKRIGGAIRKIVPGAGEPALRELIFAACIRAKGVCGGRLLIAPAPEQLGASDEPAVDRPPERPVSQRRIDPVDPRREVGTSIGMAVCDRGA